MSAGTTPRAIRIPDDLWDEARKQAAARGTTISDVVRDGLRAWLDTPQLIADLTADDFRIRKTAAGYRISQRIGSGWETLADLHATRDDARQFIAAALV